MIKGNSIISCIDNTDVKLVKVFQVVGCRRRRKANLKFCFLISLIVKGRAMYKWGRERVCLNGKESNVKDYKKFNRKIKKYD